MMVDTTSTTPEETRNHATNNCTTQQVMMNSYHTDFVFATALDVYGRRMATVSGDRIIRIWDLLPDGSWQPTHQWPAHKSAVTCVSWAHAEFGILVATGGTDQQVHVWEEVSSSSSSSITSSSGSTNTNAAAAVAAATTTRVKWNLKASLTDARRGVTCTEFAPRQWGLKLATGSLDGCVRIYEAVDIMNLEQWPISATLQAFTSDAGCTSISWSLYSDTPMRHELGNLYYNYQRYRPMFWMWRGLRMLVGVTIPSLWRMRTPCAYSNSVEKHRSRFLHKRI